MTTTTKQYVPEGAIPLNEAKRRLGLAGVAQVHALRDDGEIQAFRLGSTWWVVESSVETYLEKMKGEGSGSTEANSEQVEELHKPGVDGRHFRRDPAGAGQPQGQEDSA